MNWSKPPSASSSWKSSFCSRSYLLNISIAKKNKLRNVIQLCQKTVGISLNHLDCLRQARATPRTKAILANPRHPLHAELQPLLSKTTCTFPRRAKSNTYLKSFVPPAVGSLNNLCTGLLGTMHSLNRDDRAYLFIACIYYCYVIFILLLICE